MTTIVYKEGVMVCDSRAYSGSILSIGHKKKIWRLPGGVLVGVTCRTAGLGEHLARWYADGRDPSYVLPEAIEKHTFSLLAVHPNGEGYFANDCLLLSGPLTAEHWALGTGDQYAIGAMSMGASAEKAAEIAALHDPWSQPPFHVLTHEGKPCPLP